MVSSWECWSNIIIFGSTYIDKVGHVFLVSPHQDQSVLSWKSSNFPLFKSWEIKFYIFTFIFSRLRKYIRLCYGMVLMCLYIYWALWEPFSWWRWRIKNYLYRGHKLLELEPDYCWPMTIFWKSELIKFEECSHVLHWSTLFLLEISWLPI